MLFFVEDLRPIQLSRFDFQKYVDGRCEFTRDEWMDVVLRSVGLELRDFPNAKNSIMLHGWLRW